MSERQIKNWIRKDFRLHGNQKIFLFEKKQKFKIIIGDCYSDWIEYPTSLKRELKLIEIGI